ncbi:MAG: YdcH family protein [Pseudomonadota bacterium]
MDASHFFNARESRFNGANEDALQARLSLLTQEHSDLDAAINALATTPGHDGLALARLKKKKLQLKDMIQKLRDQLTPDIIA